jgi:AmmeMemoRadiSam system protein A
VTLDHWQRHALVYLARQSILAKVNGTGAADVAREALPGAAGVFVTIRIGGELRGCLGTLDVVEDLWTEVARCAADAACEDLRFAPVTAAELSSITVEVSVLSPLERIDPHDPDAIVVGVHGLLIEHGQSRGLLLPQVAVEWSWTREQFLQQTCLKAGLSPHAWRANASVYRFAADVFGD